MLKLLRHKNVAKIVLWAILILILPAFVIWGTGNLGSTKEGGPKYAGIINNKKVSFDDFADSLVSMQCQIKMNFSGQPQIAETFLKNRPLMGKMAWQRLVMFSEAKKHWIRISDAEVVSQIQSLPFFSRNGKFDEGIYNYALRNYLNMAPRSFEEMVRENLAIQKLHGILTKDLKASDDEILKQYKTDGVRYRISYLIVPTTAKDMAGAQAEAEKKYSDICDLIKQNNASFEAAAEKLGSKTQEAGPFTKMDNVGELGPMAQVAEKASKLKADELSGPVITMKGFVIFKLLETKEFDETKFKNDKDAYSKKLLEEKKNEFLSEWLKQAEAKSVIKIDLNDYEKYYK